MPPVYVCATTVVQVVPPLYTPGFISGAYCVVVPGISASYGSYPNSNRCCVSHDTHMINMPTWYLKYCIVRINSTTHDVYTDLWQHYSIPGSEVVPGICMI